jgi:hypothetical protein
VLRGACARVDTPSPSDASPRTGHVRQRVGGFGARADAEAGFEVEVVAEAAAGAADRAKHVPVAIRAASGASMRDKPLNVVRRAESVTPTKLPWPLNVTMPWAAAPTGVAADAANCRCRRACDPAVTRSAKAPDPTPPVDAPEGTLGSPVSLVPLQSF